MRIYYEFALPDKIFMIMWSKVDRLFAQGELKHLICFEVGRPADRRAVV
jgi:hypothetical protein